jgi:hypothetical protein
MAAAMKEIVLVRLAADPAIGAIDPTAPFIVIPRRELRRGGLYEKESEAIAQFLPSEREARFEAEWTEDG